jgi:hypothetical protein
MALGDTALFSKTVYREIAPKINCVHLFILLDAIWAATGAANSAGNKVWTT